MPASRPRSKQQPAQKCLTNRLGIINRTCLKMEFPGLNPTQDTYKLYDYTRDETGVRLPDMEDGYEPRAWRQGGAAGKATH